jgi:VWFA-related protein
MRTIPIVASLAVAVSALAQNKPAAENTDPVIRSDVREVLLDVVVRKKNLSLDKQLKASDFTVLEDGVPQTIKTFRFVGGGDARAGKAPAPQTAAGPAVKAAAAQANSTREPNFISIVFDSIGRDSRQNALEAAKDFLQQQFQENTYAAIFGLNLRLSAVQGFTSDRAALLRGVDKAVRGNSMELASANASVLNQTDYTIAGGQTGVTNTPGIDFTQSVDLATSGASQAPFSEAQQAIAGMIAAQRPMVSNIAGMRVLEGLLRMVEYESRLPGRKTVLYLSDGLVKPPDRQDFMRQVIGAANRGNVSFYCIDVRGLTLASSNGMTAGLTATAAGRSATQGTAQSSPTAARQQMQQDDLVLEALSSQTQLNMAELAESTGGFAVFNTNDFKKSMARIMEDVRTHYEISYVPASTLYDGHFRKIEVAVADKRLSVQTRDGYFAVPDLNGQTVMPYEMSGLRALNGAPKNDFRFSAAALRFKPSAEGYRYEMGFDLETANLPLPVDEKTHKARIHAVFLALVKDSRGQIVGKVSQELDRDVPADKLEQFRKGRTIVTAPFEVPSGRYTIEAAVTDPETGHAATKRLSLVVPKPGSPSLSTPALVRDVEPLSDGERDPGNPLEFQGGKVLPALSEDVSAGRDAALYFVIYPEQGAAKPTVTVQFLKDGKEVSRLQPEPGTPDMVNSLPMITAVRLPAGDYVARVTVDQAGRRSQEALPVTVSAMPAGPR